MHKKIWLTIGLIGVVVLIGIFIYLQYPQKTNAKERIIMSPIPKTLAQVMNNIQVLGDNIPWIPGDKVTIPQVQSPPIFTAESAISVDLTTKQVIFEKNSTLRRPVASTTKIMTALIALENAPLDKEITVSDQAATVGEDSMGVSVGERYTLKELLYGLMLVSGNDASEAIAESIGGRREVFISMMNAKAESLGLKDTKYVNPSGLDGDGEHYSSAHDLIVLTQYILLKFPVFQDIVATREYIIPYSTLHKQIFLTNETNLLTTYPGVKGVKTGYTPDAGLCLVTRAVNQKQDILAVVLGSTDRRGDMTKLLDYSFSSLGILIRH